MLIRVFIYTIIAITVSVNTYTNNYPSLLRAIAIFPIVWIATMLFEGVITNIWCTISGKCKKDNEKNNYPDEKELTSKLSELEEEMRLEEEYLRKRREEEKQRYKNQPKPFSGSPEKTTINNSNAKKKSSEEYINEEVKKFQHLVDQYIELVETEPEYHVYGISVDIYDNGIYKGYKHIYLISDNKDDLIHMFDFYKSEGLIPRGTTFEITLGSYFSVEGLDSLNKTVEERSVGSQGILAVRTIEDYNNANKNDFDEEDQRLSIDEYVNKYGY